MESDDIGNLSFFSCQHCQWWNECMAALAMNQIPCAMFNTRKHLWGDAVVTLRGPGPYTDNAHSPTRETTSNFIDMRFNTTHIREVSRSHHQNVKVTCFSRHQPWPFYFFPD